MDRYTELGPQSTCHTVTEGRRSFQSSREETGGLIWKNWEETHAMPFFFQTKRLIIR